MALIHCPKCGTSISDKAAKCVKCGWNLKTERTNSNVFKKWLYSLRKPMTFFHRKKILICTIAVPLLVFAAAGIFLLQNYFSALSINVIQIKKWKLIDENTYEATITTDETRSFVAVIGDYKDNCSFPQLVFMDEGVGKLEVYNYGGDYDPSLEFKPLGYLIGPKVNEKDFSSIHYDDFHYIDYDSDSQSTCTIKIDFEMKKKKTGILIYDLINHETKKTTENCMVTIADGSGQVEYDLGIPYRQRGVDVAIVPKMFLEMAVIEEGAYEIEKPFMVEKDSVNDSLYRGSATLFFNRYNDGFIFYSKELVSGGELEERGVTKVNIVYLHNNVCEITTVDIGEDIVKPIYNIAPLGYLTWTEL